MNKDTVELTPRRTDRGDMDELVKIRKGDLRRLILNSAMALSFQLGLDEDTYNKVLSDVKITDDKSYNDLEYEFLNGNYSSLETSFNYYVQE